MSFIRLRYCNSIRRPSKVSACGTAAKPLIRRLSLVKWVCAGCVSKALLSARGTVRLPGSKSISNRVLLLAALAAGTTLALANKESLVIGGRHNYDDDEGAATDRGTGAVAAGQVSDGTAARAGGSR